MEPEKINGRTAEEIKQGILCSNGCCDCQYASYINEDETCSEYVTRDTLALIAQLEAERDAALAKVPKWIQMTEETRPKSSGYYVALVNSPLYGMRKVMLRYDAEDDDWYAEFEPYETCVNSRVTHWIDSLLEPPDEQKEI